MELALNGKLIGARADGIRHPTYVIAELSANHGHDFERAAEIVRAAKHAGADAIKLQTYTAETLTLDCDRAEFQINEGTIWDGQRLFDLYNDAHMPWEWQPKLKALADEIEIDLFSSPFDGTAVDFLETMNVPAYKIASFEIVDTGLIRRVAQVCAGTGRPMIISTGMSTPEEIELALSTARDAGVHELILLKCTSAYPAPPESMNLATIADMRERFGVPVGLSDHTLGITAAVTSVALGAAVIEKHVCLSRDHGGPDAAFSLEPDELKQLVTAVREAEAAIGSVSYGASTSDAGNKNFRRSLFIVKDVRAGEVFTRENVRSIRPGHGLAPKFLDDVLGKVASSDFGKGTPLNWDAVTGANQDPKAIPSTGGSR